jgi:hypothetical protein
VTVVLNGIAQHHTGDTGFLVYIFILIGRKGGERYEEFLLVAQSAENQVSDGGQQYQATNQELNPNTF